MGRKYSITEFEGLWQKDPERYGCVPIQQAVKSLETDEPDVSMLIQKGILEFFEIGGDSGWLGMVSLKSLLLFKMARATPTQERSARILTILTEAARCRKTLPYGDVMQAVGLTYQDANHREKFTADLREATKQSELYEHGLIISALLVLKIQHIGHDDFFLMAQELGMFTPGKDSKTAFFRDHIERIFRYYEGR